MESLEWDTEHKYVNKKTYADDKNMLVMMTLICRNYLFDI